MAQSAPGFEKYPDHKVELSPPHVDIVVLLKGAEIARSKAAVRLDEDRYPERYYIPQSDVDMSKLSATDHTSYCPFKGTARYWTVDAGGVRAENSAWAYDDPYEECLPIKGYVSFYGDDFEFLES